MSAEEGGGGREAGMEWGLTVSGGPLYMYPCTYVFDANGVCISGRDHSGFGR